MVDKNLKIKQVQVVKERRIGELITNIIDHRGKTPKKLGGDWIAHGVPVISAKNIKNKKLSRLEDIRFISKEIAEKWMPVKLEENDVLVTSEGATLGELAILKQKKNYCIGQRLFAIRCDSKLLDPYYLYYYLISNRGQNEIFTRATGSTVEGLRQYEVENILINLPSIEVQKKIGITLSLLDEKIDFLMNENKILEQIIKSIFKSWFIDFEGVTEFEDSELGQIPKGWSIKNLEDIVKVKGRIGWRGYTTQDLREDGPLVIGGTHITKNHMLNLSKPIYISREKFVESPEIQIQLGDIIVTKNGNSIGQIALVDRNIGNATINPNVVLLKNSNFHNYLFYFMIAPKGQNYLLSSAGGSAIPTINNQIFKKMIILIPDIILLEKFETVTSKLRGLMNINGQQINFLENIRNVLLPKLMSGEIRV